MGGGSELKAPGSGVTPASFSPGPLGRQQLQARIHFWSPAYFFHSHLPGNTVWENVL